MFAMGEIDAAQLTPITERFRADRVQAAAALDAALPPAVPSNLIGPKAGEVWGGLSMDVKRAVVDALVTVIILPNSSGKAWDSGTVQITRRN